MEMAAASKCFLYWNFKSVFQEIFNHFQCILNIALVSLAVLLQEEAYKGYQDAIGPSTDK